MNFLSFLSRLAAGVLLLTFAGPGYGQDYMVSEQAPNESYLPLLPSHHASSGLLEFKQAQVTSLAQAQAWMRSETMRTHNVRWGVPNPAPSVLLKPPTNPGRERQNKIPSAQSILEKLKSFDPSGPYAWDPYFNLENFNWFSLLKPAVIAADPFMEFGYQMWRLARDLTKLGLSSVHSETYDACVTALTSFRQFSQWAIAKASRTTEPIYIYRASNGFEIPVYNAFGQDDRQLTADDFKAMRGLLDLLPEDHRQAIPAVLFMPNWTQGIAFGAAYRNVGVGLTGAPDLRSGTFAHEIGHMVLFDNENSFAGEEWPLFHGSEPGWDSVVGRGYYPEHPLTEEAASSENPYGGTNPHEDFATIYADWIDNSAAPALNQPMSTSIFEESIRRAGLGHPRLLQKTLMMTTFFMGEDHSLTTFRRERLSLNGAYEKVEQSVKVTQTTLTVGSIVFDLDFKTGTLLGASLPAAEVTLPDGRVLSTKPVHYAFTTPVAIPWTLRLKMKIYPGVAPTS